jgi:hypothetical protein
VAEKAATVGGPGGPQGGGGAKPAGAGS